jgi:hypothetical protein
VLKESKVLLVSRVLKVFKDLKEFRELKVQVSRVLLVLKVQ